MQTTPQTSLGDTIRRLRLAAGLTQWEIAVRTGLSLSAIQSIERGRRPGSRASLRAIAAALGVPVEQLTAVA